MRRSSRFGLILLAILLIACAGLYTAFWFVAADRIRDGVEAWAQSERAQNLDVAWDRIGVGGYPFAFRLDLGGLRVHDAALNPVIDVQAAVFEASARPWAFRHWRLLAAQGLTATAGGAEAAAAKITAEHAAGAISVPAEGGATIWLSLRQAQVIAGYDAAQIAAGAAHGWLIFPAQAPRQHTDRNVALAADLQQLSLPAAPPGFGATIADAAFGATVMGPIPSAPPREAAEAWRQAGGTVELDNAHLAWSNLRVSGSGTLTLDSDLQPTGSFSGRIGGYDELMNALVSGGQLRANDARLARFALAMLAKPGPEGRPEIATSLTIQNGDVFLGPAKIGRAPRIAWQ